MIGAIDIGGTKIAVGVIGDGGAIQASAQWPTQSISDPEAAVAQISDWLLRFPNLAGAGIACTGPVDPRSGEVGNVELLPGWEGFPLADRLTARLKLPVALENDADAAALAEAEWGAGRGAHRFIYITISTGIGAGIVFDGHLYRGVDGSHPELGHQALDPNGPVCYCGARGCWESLASGPAMVAWATANSPSTLLADLTARDLCNLARSGDSFAESAVRNEATWLGIGVANLVTIFSPDVVVLGGGVMESADLFLADIRTAVRSRCGLVPSEKVRIDAAQLKHNAALIGAARVWQTRFLLPELKVIAT